MSKNKRWTDKDLIGLNVVNSQKTVNSCVIPAVDKSCAKIKIPKQDPKGLAHIKFMLQLLSLDFETEHQFHPVRKFRFDVALINEKIAIEYEGLISDKSGHTTIDGFTSDCDKYNLAILFGWKVLRYTAKNYENIYNDLETILKNEL